MYQRAPGTQSESRPADLGGCESRPADRGGGTGMKLTDLDVGGPSFIASFLAEKAGGGRFSPRGFRGASLASDCFA